MINRILIKIMLKKSNAFKFLIGTFVFAVALMASSAFAAMDFGTTTLREGSRGEYVKNVQTLVGAIPDGAFGPMTKAKVATWQSVNGLTADGIFGPMSMAKANGMTTPVTPVTPGSLCPNGMTLASNCTVAPGTTTTVTLCPNGMTLASNCMSAPGTTGTTGALMGGAGSLQTVDVLSTYSNEDVLEGSNDTKVMGFEFEADNGSDLAIQNVRLEFEMTGTGNTRMNKYMSNVSVWQGSTKVGSANVSEFSESSDVYSKAINLSNAVIRDGEKSKFYVSVDALSNIDSNDFNEDWTVTLESVRFMDATGVVVTDSNTGDLGQSVDFSFEDLTSSGDLELKATEGSNSPTAQVVEVDDVSDTTDVLLLEVKLAAKGSDMTVDELEFNITPTGANANVIVKEYMLLVDGKEIDSIAAGSIVSTATGTILFTDLEDDFMVKKDGSVTVRLVADINDLEGTFDNGDSILASFTNANFIASSVDDKEGDILANGDRSGSVTGEAQTFYNDGIQVSLVSVDNSSVTIDGANNDRAELIIKFKVTAIGQNAYIPALATGTSFSTSATATAPSTVQGVGYGIQYNGVAADATTVTSTTLTSTADEETNSFKVDEGSSETFTLKVIVQNDGTPDLSGSYRAILGGINFGDSDSATGDFVFTSNLVQDYKTAYSVIVD